MSIDFECFEPILQDPPKEGRNRERMDGPSTRCSGHLALTQVRKLPLVLLPLHLHPPKLLLCLPRRPLVGVLAPGQLRARLRRLLLAPPQPLARVSRRPLAHLRKARKERKRREGGRRTESDGRRPIRFRVACPPIIARNHLHIRVISTRKSN